MPNLRGNQDLLRRFQELQKSKNQSNPLTDYLGQQFGDSSNNVKFQSVLEQLGSGNTDISQLLSSFLGAGDNSFTDERWDMLYQYLLGLMSQANQRAYDVEMRDESRLYSTPTNELARLMGAGVSRDAAIQILSGAAGGSGVGSAMIGSGASPFTTSPTGISGTQDIARQQMALNGVQVALQGIQTVMDLVGQGIDMSTAISQSKMMQAQSQMTQAQLGAFNGVNNISQAFHNAVLDGTLSIDDIQGLRTSDDYYKWIVDHADTKLVKPLIENGSVASVFGSTYGRSMMNQHLEQTRQSRDAAQLFDAYLKQNDLDADLKEVSVAQSRRDFYVSFQNTMNDILASDVNLANLYQSYLNGEKELEINGVRVDLAKYQRAAAKRQNVLEQNSFNAYQSALNRDYTLEQDGKQVTVSGYALLNYNQMTTLLRSYQNNRALSGLQGVQVGDKQGGYTIMSARDRYAKMLDNNIEIAITGAFVQDVINNNRLSGYSGSLAPLYRFADMWNASGLGNVVSIGSNLLPDVTFNTGDKIFVK